MAKGVVAARHTKLVRAESTSCLLGSQLGLQMWPVAAAQDSSYDVQLL